MVTLLFAYINYRGAEETGKAETIVTVIKIIIIAVFCLSGVWAIVFHTENWQQSFSSIKNFVPNG